MGVLDLLDGGQNKDGGMSPITMALLALLAYRSNQGKGRLADTAGRNQPDDLGGALSPTADHHSVDGLLGLSGGAAGSMLSSGLKDLIDNFQANGQGDKVRSWISDGPNQEMVPADLEQGLGEERVEWLMAQTRLPKEALLEGLSRALPSVVDRLTPEGRLPDEREAERLAS